MANSKISALTSASTPLTGTETLPVVQSSATTQVTVANLTAGRAVSGLSFAAATLGAPSSTTLSIQANGTTYVTVLGAGTNNGYVGIGTVTPAYLCDVSGGDFRVTRGSGDGFIWIGNQSSSYYISGGTSSNSLYAVVAGSTAFTITSSQNFNFNQNLVQVTAAKGVNFTANTPAAGMTSQLLNWYEEGTWTPADASGAGLTFTSVTAKYTRIGRQVTATVVLTFPITTNASQSAISGLPFAASNMGQFLGIKAVAVGASQGLVLAGGTTIFMYTQTGASQSNAANTTATLYFTGTYFV